MAPDCPLLQEGLRLEGRGEPCTVYGQALGLAQLLEKNLLLVVRVSLTWKQIRKDPSMLDELSHSGGTAFQWKIEVLL